MVKLTRAIIIQINPFLLFVIIGLIFSVVISLSYVHRSQPLWKKSPFSNTWWCLTVPVV